MCNNFFEALEEWGIAVDSKLILPIILFLAVKFVFLLMGAVGICRLASDEGFKKPWLVFVLPIYPLVLGKLTAKYVKKDGTSSQNYGVWLFVMAVLNVIFSVAFFIAFAVSFTNITNFALQAIENNTAMTIEMFSSVIYAVIFYFVALTVYLVYFVMYTVALNRIFKLYNGKKAKLLTVLSVFFRFLSPFFVYLSALKNSYNAEDL